MRRREGVPPPDRPSTGRNLLPPRPRKILLTVHVIASVGWIGADLCLLALAVVGLTGGDERTQQAAYVALGALATYVSTPVSIAALLSGIAVSVTTRWGLLRYWWVLISLVATTGMTAAVVLALAPRLRRAAADALAAPPGTPVLEAVGANAGSALSAPIVAFVLLSLVTAINVIKPWGRIGARAKQGRSPAPVGLGEGQHVRPG